MATSAEIRQQLVAALRSDLIGPGWDDRDRRHEPLSQPPSVAQGLHSSGTRKAVGGQRGLKPRASKAAQTPSFQLEPEPQQMNFDLKRG